MHETAKEVGKEKETSPEVSTNLVYFESIIEEGRARLGLIGGEEVGWEEDRRFFGNQDRLQVKRSAGASYGTIVYID